MSEKTVGDDVTEAAGKAKVTGNCDVCGKPRSPYPNWIIGKGHAFHIGCLFDAYLELIAQRKK